MISGAISPHGIPNQILRALQRDDFTLVSAPDLIDEVIEVLGRRRFSERYRPDQAIVTAIITELQAAVVQPIPLDALPIHCRDPKDDPILACALGGNADNIVTGDEDLLVLDGHPALGSLRIVTPRAFLTILERLTDDA
jgi:putative PIN family toxin of toxin-antitoxin system